jgi:23S rRNA pseudouridine1911/1915/1917 synthase
MSHRHFKISPEHQGLRLDIFLVQELDQSPSRSFVQKLIEQGCVKVNNRLATAKHKLRDGEGVEVNIPEDFLTPQYAAPEDIPLDVFYQDGHLLIINKPCGMVVHPAAGQYSGTLVNALLHLKVGLSDFGDDLRPGIVHRLDQDTSGLMVVARNNMAHARLAKLFQRREVKKQYLALLEGRVGFDEGLVDQPIGRDRCHREKMAVTHEDGARDAVTRYRVLRRLENATLVALYPTTGRTHQLRVHMRYLGNPVLGDPKYGNRRAFPRLALHAQSIGFRHPFTKRYIEFCSSPPAEFMEFIRAGENEAKQK